MKRIVNHVKASYHRRYKVPHQDRAHWVFLFDQFLVGIILTLLAIGTYYAFFFHPIRDDFRFTADIPTLVAGEEADVKLTISNLGEKRFHNALFEAYLPDRFLISTYPEGYDPETKSTPVGIIEPGAVLSMTMRGMVIGPADEVPVFVRMVASDEEGVMDERIFKVVVSWKENRMKGTFSHPDAILGSQAFPMTLIFKNDSKLKLDDVRVRPSFPEGYKLQAATPPLANGEARIGPVDPGESVELRFSGRTPPSLDSFKVSADIIWIKDKVEILLDQPTLEHRAVTTNLDIKAAFDAATPVQPGADVPFTVEYANNGAYNLKKVVFSVSIDGRLVDATEAKLAVGSFEVLKPGDRGTLSGVLKLKKSFTQFVTNPELSITPQAVVSIDEPKIVNATVSGTASGKRKIAGTADLVAVARYFTAEGEQLGRGILPPKVGKETRYWIFLAVTTGSSDIRETLVETTLPANVRWTGRSAVSAGDELIARESGNVIVWRVGDLPAHLGATDSQATASFEVVLIPTAAQVGSPAFLVDHVDLTGLDAWTNLNVEDRAEGVTTELRTDDRIRGRIFVSP